MAGRADLHRALRRAARRRSISARPRAHARICRAFRLRIGIFGRWRRSIRALSKRSTLAASTRSSARRRRGRRACAFRRARVHVCYINTVSRFAFALRRVRRRSRAPVARAVCRAADRLGSRGGEAPDALRRKLAQRRGTHPQRTTAAMPTCCTAPSTSTASPSAAARAITSSSRRGCCRTNASISRFAPHRSRASAAGRRNRTGGTRAARAREGTTTTMLGYVPDARLNELLGNARAAIVPGEEDFGLVPLEAAAAGRPTIAFRGGGALETIVEGETGHVFRRAGRRVARGVPARLSIRRATIRSVCARTPRRSRRAKFIERLRAIVERVYSESEHDADGRFDAARRSASMLRFCVAIVSLPKLRPVDRRGDLRVRLHRARSQQAVRVAVRRRSRDVSADAREPAARFVVELRRVAAAFSSARFVGVGAARAARRALSAGQTLIVVQVARGCMRGDSAGVVRSRARSRRASGKSARASRIC